MISAQVIADSKNEFGNRLTTMVVTFPRIILAEFNTHRMLSKNSASSRAIPFEKMVKSVEENPFIPIAWQKDHKGMQGTEYFTDEVDILACQSSWGNAKRSAIAYATSLSNLGATKQLANRLLEPFMWHTVIVSGTEWENFFALRCPHYRILDNDVPRYFRSRKDLLTFTGSSYGEGYTETDWLQQNEGQAEIHMMALAEAMWDAMNESTPKELKAGEWHIPFGDQIDLHKIIELNRKEDTGQPLSEVIEETGKLLKDWSIKIATARCARISYTVVGEEGKPDNYENDIKLHDRLLASGHMSPFEHCAKAMTVSEQMNIWSGNFKGFIQYRKMIPNENKV